MLCGVHVGTPSPMPSTQFNCAVPLCRMQSAVLSYIRSLCEAPIAVCLCTPCGQLWLALITVYRRTLTAVIHPHTQYSTQSPPSWPPSALRRPRKVRTAPDILLITAVPCAYSAVNVESSEQTDPVGTRGCRARHGGLHGSRRKPLRKRFDFVLENNVLVVSSSASPAQNRSAKSGG